MANDCIPCPTCLPSLIGLPTSDPNNPFLNISSEAPDVDLFLARGYTTYLPPLGSFFYAVGCVGFAFGTTQEEADLAAARQNVLCNGSNWPTGPNPGTGGNGGPGPGGGRGNPTNPRSVYPNDPQSCQVVCADGTVNTNPVPAGTFFGFSKAEANAKAIFYCNLKKYEKAICLGPLSQSRVCFGSAFNAVIGATSNYYPILFVITSGGLPDGVTMEVDPLGEEAIFTGTPTVGGDFSFTLEATDSNGNQVSNVHTITVFGITNSTPLPPGQMGNAYSDQLVLEGTPVGTPVFSVVSGSLPAGLALNPATGVISGTPTTIETAVFSVAVTDDTLFCQRNLTLDITTGETCFSNPTALPAPEIGVPYSLALIPVLVPDPGNALYFVITNGALPNGLSLDINTGVISGVPTETSASFCVGIGQSPI